MSNLTTLVKFLSISIFVISIIVIVIYSNYLMIYRPNYKITEYGLIYPFIGKGNKIYISIQDYMILLISIVSLLLSIVAANKVYKKK